MADFITVPTADAIAAYYPIAHSKIKVIPQGFQMSKSLNEYFPKNSITTFGYAGAFYRGSRDPSSFLRFLANQNIDFKFIVYTKNFLILKPFIPMLGHKLEIRNHVDRTQLIGVLRQMDFLINFENAFKEQSPSKLIDYAIANRPILNVSSQFNDSSIFWEFYNKNYKNGHVIADLSAYDIQNVAASFIAL
jgi:hypothetical protein